MTITIYSNPDCIRCEATKRAFDRLGVTTTMVDLSHDRAAAALLREAGHTELPVVLTPDGQTWTGFRIDKIRAAAAASRADRTQDR